MTVPHGTNDVPSPYIGMERQAIGGEWRQGGSGRWNVDSDPYSGDTIVEIKLATRQDVDAAYGAAKSAQRGWRNRLPDERAQAMYRAAAIIDERREEITSWLVRESGSTRIASLMS